MNERTRLGIATLIASLVLGVIGDMLLRETPWGINLFAWVACVSVAMAVVAYRQGSRLTASGRWLFLPVIFFAAAFAWRDSTTLKVLDALALVATLSVAVTRAQAVRLQLAGITQYTTGLLITAFNATFGPLILALRDIEWKEVPHEGPSRHALAVGRGFAIASPLLFVFGSLFAAADAIFEGIVKNIFYLHIQTLVLHAFIIVLCAWVACGSLRAVLFKREFPFTNAERPKLLSLGIVEIGIALGLLNVLFFAFVVVQLRYFFGGAAMIEATTKLTYAEYARRGFFELVTVAALVLPLLLAAHWLLRKQKPADERIFRTLAGAQVVMLFVIMASAVQRMRLYQSEYGLTQLRLYTTAFMVWLALIFVWFAATVLRGERERFAFGALTTGLLMIAFLHALNPDALIVRTNVARTYQGKSFDAYYATSLSADGVPALIESLPALAEKERCIVSARVLEAWTPLEHSDWRAWSWARSQAWREIQANGTTLWQTACWPKGK